MIEMECASLPYAVDVVACLIEQGVYSRIAIVASDCHLILRAIQLAVKDKTNSSCFSAHVCKPNDLAAIRGETFDLCLTVDVSKSARHRAESLLQHNDSPLALHVTSPN
jgi:3-oxoacyl-[acyl-carrier-protein] synthase III